MKIINCKVPRNFNLFLAGDYHLGTILCYEDGIKKLIDMMQKEYLGTVNNFLVTHGDSIEAITPDDKRFDNAVSTDYSRPLAQAEAFVKLFLPIKNKIICNLCGNHEMKITRNHSDLAKWISEQLGIYYGTYTSIIKYYDDKNNLLFKHFATHGYGTINSSADDDLRRETTMKLSLKKRLKDKMGDCELMSMGHTHRLLVNPPLKKFYLTTENKNIKNNYTSRSISSYINPDNRWYVNTGSFYKLYGNNVSGYAEKAGYNPLELGFAIARIRDGVIQGVDKIIID